MTGLALRVLGLSLSVWLISMPATGAIRESTNYRILSDSVVAGAAMTNSAQRRLFSIVGDSRPVGSSQSASYHLSGGTIQVVGLVDSDGDGSPADQDNCPDDYNPGQLDTDGDDLGNSCDPDDDGDGVDDNVDNCPLVSNIGQSDADNDGVGNVCDAQNQCTDPNTILVNQSYDSDFYCAAEESIVAGGVSLNSVTVGNTGNVVFTAPTIELTSSFNVAAGGVFAAGANLATPCQFGFTALADGAEDLGGLFIYSALSNASEPNDRLHIELYSPSIGSFALTGENYESCQECVLVYTGCMEGSCDKSFLAIQGLLEVTSINNLFSGTLTNTNLVEVTIDPVTYVSTPVTDGEEYCIPLFEFSATIAP